MASILSKLFTQLPNPVVDQGALEAVLSVLQSINNRLGAHIQECGAADDGSLAPQLSAFLEAYYAILGSAMNVEAHRPLIADLRKSRQLLANCNSRTAHPVTVSVNQAFCMSKSGRTCYELAGRQCAIVTADFTCNELFESAIDVFQNEFRGVFKNSAVWYLSAQEGNEHDTRSFLTVLSKVRTLVSVGPWGHRRIAMPHRIVDRLPADDFGLDTGFRDT